eukprot:scaffold82496_cov29-Tisochrysis_lutea.AAC.5
MEACVACVAYAGGIRLPGDLAAWLAISQRKGRSARAPGKPPPPPRDKRELRPREIEVSSIDCAREERRRQLDRCRTAMFGSRVATRVLLAGARPVLGVHDCLYPWLVVWRNDQVDIW